MRRSSPPLLLVLAPQLEAQLAALHGDELHLGGHPHAHRHRCHMAEINTGTHGLLPLFGKRLQGIEASTKATLHAVATDGYVSERASQGGSANTMTIRDRLWVSPAFGRSTAILAPSHASPPARPL